MVIWLRHERRENLVDEAQPKYIRDLACKTLKDISGGLGDATLSEFSGDLLNGDGRRKIVYLLPTSRWQQQIALLDCEVRKLREANEALCGQLHEARNPSTSNCGPVCTVARRMPTSPA